MAKSWTEDSVEGEMLKGACQSAADEDGITPGRALDYSKHRLPSEPWIGNSAQAVPSSLMWARREKSRMNCSAHPPGSRQSESNGGDEWRHQGPGADATKHHTRGGLTVMVLLHLWRPEVRNPGVSSAGSS